MIKVRSAQMKVFEDEALKRFENEMVLHSKEFSPRLCEVLGDDQLRVAVRQAMSRADRYGFTNRGPLRLYIEMMFLFGSDFDTDPQYPEVAEILDSSDDQMQRAEKIYKGVLDYQEKVSGQNNTNVRKALETLSAYARMPVMVNANNFEVEMFQELDVAFSQKVAYVGQKGVNELVHKGRVEALKYGFSSVREEAMMVMLMFAFGHGCTNDPLYPWISRTLQDDRIKDSSARAKRLEKKAVTWLDHVLVRTNDGVQT